MRLDQALLEMKIAPSRSKAQELIKSGSVFLIDSKGQKKRLLKSSRDVSAFELNQIIIEKTDVLKFVSRGGLKLDFALDQIKLDVSGMVVLDLGQSTGGFSDCILQRGAQFVIGVENGKDQLHESLKNDKKIKCLEKTDARALSREELLKSSGQKEFDLLVGDLSFISLSLVIPEVVKLLTGETHILFLVKPQFELEAKDLSKKGVVKDEKKFKEVKDKLVANFESLDLNVIDYFESPILGGDGNKEFFIYGKTKLTS